MAGRQYGRNGDGVEDLRRRIIAQLLCRIVPHYGRIGASRGERMEKNGGAVTAQDFRETGVAMLPAWAIRLAYRIAQLERGRAYNVVVVMVNNEPTWTVQPIGKLENGA